MQDLQRTRTIRDALAQLLSYLTWRDTKAALLLFIRRGEPTTIIAKAITEIAAHDPDHAGGARLDKENRPAQPRIRS